MRIVRFRLQFPSGLRCLRGICLAVHGRPTWAVAVAVDLRAQRISRHCHRHRSTHPTKIKKKLSVHIFLVFFFRFAFACLHCPGKVTQLRVAVEEGVREREREGGGNSVVVNLCRVWALTVASPCAIFAHLLAASHSVARSPLPSPVAVFFPSLSFSYPTSAPFCPSSLNQCQPGDPC